MVRGRKSRIILLTVLIVIALAAAVVAWDWRQADRHPVVARIVTVEDDHSYDRAGGWNMDNGWGWVRHVTISVEDRQNVSLRFDGAYDFEGKFTNCWGPHRFPALISELSSAASAPFALGHKQVTLIVPPDTEALRFKLDYRRGGWLPFGIRDSGARNMSAFGQGNWLRRRILPISRGLYYWLWPTNPPRWKTTVVELTLPTNATALVRAGLPVPRGATNETLIVNGPPHP